MSTFGSLTTSCQEPAMRLMPYSSAAAWDEAALRLATTSSSTPGIFLSPGTCRVRQMAPAPTKPMRSVSPAMLFPPCWWVPRRAAAPTSDGWTSRSGYSTPVGRAGQPIATGQQTSGWRGTGVGSLTYHPGIGFSPSEKGSCVMQHQTAALTVQADSVSAEPFLRATDVVDYTAREIQALAGELA